MIQGFPERSVKLVVQFVAFGLKPRCRGVTRQQLFEGRQFGVRQLHLSWRPKTRQCRAASLEQLDRVAIGCGLADLDDSFLHHSTVSACSTDPCSSKYRTAIRGPSKSRTANPNSA